MLVVLKRKNKHVLIRKFNVTSNEKKIYHHPTFVHHKKSPINLFFMYRMKNKLHKRKGKKIQKQKKIKILI